jgi:hypothetical protein
MARAEVNRLSRGRVNRPAGGIGEPPAAGRARSSQALARRSLRRRLKARDVTCVPRLLLELNAPGEPPNVAPVLVVVVRPC